MSVPLISNVGFTEVNSSGVLNDKAGTAKSKLPVQIFKLTDNVTGNLQMNADSAHKKIILDTNGNNITNSSGSPLTNNSSTTLELKGSGNVQSTLKSFKVCGLSKCFLPFIIRPKIVIFLFLRASILKSVWFSVPRELLQTSITGKFQILI